MAFKSNLSESQEDYLETILRLEREKRVARVTDIARAMGVRKSSVSNALRNLSKRGLVKFDKYSFATLTPEGMHCASRVDHYHAVFKTFFIALLGINEKAADANACRLEHALDNDVIVKLISLLSAIPPKPIRRKS
jgi:DtxR family transcriptional regulator, Mn-dependent transcriptional regulator